MRKKLLVMIKNLKIPYTVKESDRWIEYDTELWNWINDGIIVVYDKEQRRYTDDFQTDNELSSMGFEILHDPQAKWLLQQVAKRKHQLMKIDPQMPMFEIVSVKQAEPNNEAMIYANAITQYTLMEIFYAKLLVHNQFQNKRKD